MSELRAHARVAGLALLLLLLCSLLASRWGLLEPLWQRGYASRADQPTLVLVVLDTVRADRVSACGYDRPTTPVLQGLVEAGASLSCAAVAPGSWTLPSHASFFTGRSVVEHGVEFAPVEDGVELGLFAARPLGPEPRTLAEELVDRGYQAVSLSSNPILHEGTGLTRGFTRAEAPEFFGEWFGDRLVDRARDLLQGGVQRDRPLFLFLNIADAHTPYAAPTVPWLPPTEALHYEFEPGGPWQRYVLGDLPAAEAAALRTRVGDLYDFGVYEADRTLGELLELLRAYGWDRPGLRLVVVSDHGEMLGEHGLLSHGGTLYEPNARVPLLVWERSGSPGLPEGPLLATQAYHLILNGALGPIEEVLATAQPNPLWVERSEGRVGDQRSAALWRGPHKWHSQAGRVEHVQLALDPAELRGEPAEAPPSLQAARRANAELSDQAIETDEEMVERLRALGYLSD